MTSVHTLHNQIAKAFINNQTRAENGRYNWNRGEGPTRDRILQYMREQMEAKQARENGRALITLMAQRIAANLAA